MDWVTSCMMLMLIELVLVLGLVPALVLGDLKSLELQSVVQSWRSLGDIFGQQRVPLVCKGFDDTGCVAATIVMAFCGSAENHLLPCARSLRLGSHALVFLEMPPSESPLGSLRMSGNFGRMAGDWQTALGMAHQYMTTLGGSKEQGCISHSGLVVEHDHDLGLGRRGGWLAKTPTLVDYSDSLLDTTVANPSWRAEELVDVGFFLCVVTRRGLVISASLR